MVDKRLLSVVLFGTLCLIFVSGTVYEYETEDAIIIEGMCWFFNNVMMKTNFLAHFLQFIDTTELWIEIP